MSDFLYLDIDAESTPRNESIISEGQLQYLHFSEMCYFAQNVFTFLESGKTWRIAVPDRNNPSVFYHQKYLPNGFFQRLSNPKKFNRKIITFWSLEVLTEFLRQVGFIVYPLEYFDEYGQFVKNDWDIKDGLIEHRNGNSRKDQFLIIDAVKP